VSVLDTHQLYLPHSMRVLVIAFVAIHFAHMDAYFALQILQNPTGKRRNPDRRSIAKSGTNRSVPDRSASDEYSASRKHERGRSRAG
jgi:hypothetical protein